MRIFKLVAAIVLVSAGVCFAQSKSLIIDDLDGPAYGGRHGTIDFGAGNGSSVKISASDDIRHAGKYTLKIEYDAVAGGYIYVAKGYGLHARRSGWKVKPGHIKWRQYDAISFYAYGSNSKNKIAFDLKDSGNELWRYIFEDDFIGWMRIVIPFNKLSLRRDWQPDSADLNGVLNFPIRSFQFEPVPEGKGVIYLADVALMNK